MDNMKAKPSFNSRRDFLKKLGLSSLPILLPGIGSADDYSDNLFKRDNNKLINLVYDGLAYEPKDYIQKLQEINKSSSISADVYGSGGTTQKLEEKLAELTGKEKAIYLPTGTMANQLAIKMLNAENTKVIVPENSHIYRDEADSAQSVHGKRLVPVQNNKAYYTAEELDETIQNIHQNEVFKSGIGTVVIENPVRRANGTAVPLATIQEIAAYCKSNAYKMHLDAARIHYAEAYQGVSLKEYAAPFDTVYISLYKYLNANGGAILCGDAELIDRMHHQIKILGGTMYQSWTNSAMALHYLDGITDRFKKLADTSKEIVKALNQLDEINISSIDNGTNIYELTFNSNIDIGHFVNELDNKHNIWLRPPNEDGQIRLSFNESILLRPADEIVGSIKSVLRA
ncbi:aminotransferase class I/II-fold pyridoxal phosphate-dependent enzyme [Marivirga arenosa]|uniref:Aminotransferase class I/II-fold pyridoxal phosphate-dependent enzyme n=1 Tax=Marivirga arenosa TaxID=3059076 RepID=A0AA51N4R7_9BACT|nr:aminotransferase class I/II-fold pyridoxal phosphate-dependent enzyme [Marivirga sp. ABR2-2]WMN05969.1 aminotransferase class I/II-fold pyridoxal phosphate-dependent enzyme [Marivirga sp. ABR2-2]